MNMMSMYVINMTILTYMILCSNNPMILSIIVMLIAIMVTMTMVSYSSWYAMILFLIYIGGMMIMFSYFTSMSSNDTMMNTTYVHMLTIPYIINKSLSSYSSTSPYMSALTLHLYNPFNIHLVVLMCMILLFMMIIVVKILSSKKAPLRGFLLF